MITVQEAFERAREYARGILGDLDYTLEEVEQDTYKDQPVWRITLGFPRRQTANSQRLRELSAALPLEYKTILVNSQSGEPIAMKLAS